MKCPITLLSRPQKKSLLFSSTPLTNRALLMTDNYDETITETSNFVNKNASPDLIQSIGEFFLSLPNFSYVSDVSKDVSGIIQEHNEVFKKFEILTQQTQQQEAEDWRSISRIKDYTSIIVYIYNGSYRTFNLVSGSWDVSEEQKADCIIEPWQYTSFILSSETPKREGGKSARSTQAEHTFCFKSEYESFEFSTLLKLKLEYDTFGFNQKTVPFRNLNIRPSANSLLNFNARIIHEQAVAPYSYSIAINIS